jgi:formamidopyrimidine-DNA glycosylase
MVAARADRRARPPEVLPSIGHRNARNARDRSTVDRCELAAVSALKTFDPPLQSLLGLTVGGVTRRGKYLCVDFDGLWLVLHLARGGWLRWSDSLPAARAKLTRGPLALRLGFSDRSGFDVTEMGTEKRLAIWLVGDPNEIEGVATLGPDPLSGTFGADVLAERLAEESSTVKNALTHQSFVAGIGNAYSDEILHEARLSPFKPAARLTPGEIMRLYEAMTKTLSEAVERSRGLDADQLKGDKKRAMRVHGRTGDACPNCGDRIREVSFATKSLQYCPTCQTGGKPLADRRLSRLLK